MRLFDSTMSRSRSGGIDANHSNSNAEKVESSTEKLPKPVYYVESPDDGTVLIGIDVTVEHYKRGMESTTIVNWYDTSHERRMLADKIERKDDYLAFKRAEREGGGFYYFSPMNLDIYNSKVKNRLDTDGVYASEEDLIKAFLDSRGNDV